MQLQHEGNDFVWCVCVRVCVPCVPCVPCKPYKPCVPSAVSAHSLQLTSHPPPRMLLCKSRASQRSGYNVMRPSDDEGMPWHGGDDLYAFADDMDLPLTPEMTGMRGGAHGAYHSPGQYGAVAPQQYARYPVSGRATFSTDPLLQGASVAMDG